MKLSRYKLSPHLKKIEKGQKAYLYNSLVGTGIVVNDAATKLITMMGEANGKCKIEEEYKIPKLNELIKLMLKKKLLDDLTVVRKEKKTATFNSFDNGKLISQMRLNVTEKCNLNCDYCYQNYSNTYQKGRDMTWKIAKKSVDEFTELIQNNGHKYATIRFFGGEPFLKLDIVEKTMDYINSIKNLTSKFNFIINSNGTLIKNRKIKKLKENKVMFSVSLDGEEKDHDKYRKCKSGKGSFAIVDSGIDYLIEHGCNVGLSVTLTDQNYKNLKSIVDYAVEKKEKKGYDLPIALSPLCRIERSKIASTPTEKKVTFFIDAIKYAYERDVKINGGLTFFPFNKAVSEIGGAYCAGIGSELSIDPEGKVFSCGSSDHNMGSIFRFKDIFKSNNYRIIANRRVGTLKQCRNCAIEGFCAGGCAANAKIINGDFYKPAEDCKFMVSIFEEMIKYYLL